MAKKRTTAAQKKLKYHLSGNRAMAVIVGLLLVLLGVFLFTFPLGAMFFTDIFITIGLLMYGIYLIITFVALPSGLRHASQLILGIILVLFAAVIMTSGFVGVLVSFALVLAVAAALVAINQIIGYTALKGLPGAGYILFSGIINVLLALFLIIAPLASLTTLAIVEGIYLSITGIALIVESFAKNKPGALS